MRQCVNVLSESISAMNAQMPPQVREKLQPHMNRLGEAVLRAARIMIKHELACQSVSYALVGTSRKRPVSALDDPTCAVFLRQPVSASKRPSSAKKTSKRGAAAKARA